MVKLLEYDYKWMPSDQALQVFYGTIPLILIIMGVWFREQLLLKDILARLGRLEERMDRMENRLANVEKRLAILETRAGVIFHE
jgi:predicted small integral membrane protein